MSKTKRKNNITATQWIAHPRELRESRAWHGLPDNGRRILFRLELEHMRHGGADNGNLPCTYSDFVQEGVRRASVSLAIRQCVALGFLKVTYRGGRSISEFRDPSRYFLTYVNGRKDSVAPSDDWKQIKTAEDAQAALSRAAELKNHGTQAARGRANLINAGLASVTGAGRAGGTRVGT